MTFNNKISLKYLGSF